MQGLLFFRIFAPVNIKRNIIFSLELRKKNGVVISENVPIRMRVIYAGNRVDFSTGHRIDEKKWNAEKQQVKNGCTNKLKVSSAEINADLLYYSTVIQSVFKEFEVKNTIPTPAQLRSDFERKTKMLGKSNKKELSESFFISAFDEYVNKVGASNNWKAATFAKFKTTKKHLESFSSNTTFEKIDEKWFSAYVHYLQETAKLRNVTIEKQIKDFRGFLRWAAKKEYIGTSMLDWKPKLKTVQKKVIFLTQEELKKIQKYIIPAEKKYLERVRDVFLFQCFTGLRYSDVFNLKRSNIKKDHIEITTVKTADSLTIGLNKHSRKILNKYKKTPFENDKVLPVITNQKMNEYLQELARLAKINEMVSETTYRGNERIDTVTPKHKLIGTHCGRRTFISNALMLGVTPEIVMKWTGHSDYKAMKPYIDVADSAQKSAMGKFDNL